MSQLPRIRSSRGQVAAELVAVIPLLLGLLLAVAQLALVGYALWSAGTAARAGARAELVGGNGESSALSALPGWLAAGAEIETAPPLEVAVEVPALLPGAPSIALSASTELGGEDE